jgi:hypothetical protein
MQRDSNDVQRMRMIENEAIVTHSKLGLLFNEVPDRSEDHTRNIHHNSQNDSPRLKRIF